MYVKIEFVEDKKWPVMRVTGPLETHGVGVRLLNWGQSMARNLIAFAKRHREVTKEMREKGCCRSPQSFDALVVLSMCPEEFREPLMKYYQERGAKWGVS